MTPLHKRVAPFSDESACATMNEDASSTQYQTLEIVIIVAGSRYTRFGSYIIVPALQTLPVLMFVHIIS